MQNQGKISLFILIDRIFGRQNSIECNGLAGSEKALLASRLHDELSQPLVVVLPSVKEADTFLSDLRFFSDISEDSLLYFPPYDTLSFKFLSSRSETSAMRIRSLYRLMDSDLNAPPLLVTTVDALLRKVIPKEEIVGYAELLMVGEAIDRDMLISKLIYGGYDRTVMVEDPGEFCVRGGILDVFCPLYEMPMRVEFYGETVDTIRFFSPENQRTKENFQEMILLPAGEAIFKPDRQADTIRRVREQAAELDIPVRALRGAVERIKEQAAFPGSEGWISLIYDKLDTLFNYTPTNTLFMVSEPITLAEHAAALKEQNDAAFENTRTAGDFSVNPESIHLSWEHVQDILKEKKSVTIRALPAKPPTGNDEGLPQQLSLSVEDNSNIRTELKRRKDQENLFQPLANWIQEKEKSALTPVLVCRNRAQTDRLTSLLTPYGILPEFKERLSDIQPGKDTCAVCPGRISSGFVWPEEALAVLTDDEIFGVKRRRKRVPRKQVRTDLVSLGELKKGDLIVHTDHGIGKYEGLVKLTVDGATNDFLLLRYRGNDKLYLPIDRMNMVQKYIGVDGIEPALDKMGGKSWDRVKDRVKRSVEKIAGDLLKLYSARKIKKGISFGKPDSYFQDFEAAFPFEETTDQIRAIDDVLADMENEGAMDRLVCGDVGYGKTEVALRASFLAAYNGKQTAMLVPTTVLAEQHFHTFTERFQNYPVNIACLSRFRPPGEQRAIVEELKAGYIDIVIGTHRLLQKDIAFKDIGLVIIDEEQRFGVKHKEKLKKLRDTVDVLALTATPIPRTLHMSLMGIRDISVISTPPEHRHPILTYVSEFDDNVIISAIRKELDRQGQIFFVHNNIYNIESIANYLQELVPEVHLDIAHGRMSEKALEDVMVRFIKRDIDMLVCTTIIESGLDIPSANTILVNRADRFGLAQMYQLRGRVGRADEQAFAYLFIPKNYALGKDAQKRLKVLMEHSDLGSGFQLAMSDLNIRGGGTILGAAQSGHIAAVGYDMFLQLMEDSIATLKGEPVSDPLEPEINVPLSTFIPEAYIPDIDQRLLSYRRLAKLTEVKDVGLFEEELVDRFGQLPPEVQNLLGKIVLKIWSKKSGVKKLTLSGGQLLLQFSEKHVQNPQGLIDMVLSKKNSFEFTSDHGLKVTFLKENQNVMLSKTKNILKEITQRVNA